MIRDGFFTPGNEGEFKDLVDMLLYHDRFLTLADYKAYISSQEMVSKVGLINYYLIINNLVCSGVQRPGQVGRDGYSQHRQQWQVQLRQNNL